MSEWSSRHNGEIPSIPPPSAYPFQHSARVLMEDGGQRVCKPTVDFLVSLKRLKQNSIETAKAQSHLKGWHEGRGILTVQYFRTYKVQKCILSPPLIFRGSSTFILPLRLGDFSSFEIQKRGFCLGHETWMKLKFQRHVNKRISAGLGLKPVYINSQFRNTPVMLFSIYNQGFRSMCVMLYHRNICVIYHRNNRRKLSREVSFWAYQSWNCCLQQQGLSNKSRYSV